MLIDERCDFLRRREQEHYVLGHVLDIEVLPIANVRKKFSHSSFLRVGFSAFYICAKFSDAIANEWLNKRLPLSTTPSNKI